MTVAILTRKMEAIFHEKQEGALCAQHCLNVLLQGHYFTAVDLADIARQLDEIEREQMAEGGTDSAGYKKFLEQPSSNYDDSGFFSVQVIQTALKIWGLELTPYNSQCELAQLARRDPTTMKSFICNFGEHWLTIRKLGNQWFNLNSLLTGPELISDTFLSMFLAQLQQEGYSIFVVGGNLIECEADLLLRLSPAVQPIKPQLINQKGSSHSTNENREGERDEEFDFALKESERMNDVQDQSLRKALQLSMEGYIEESLNRIDGSQTDPPQTCQSTDGPAQSCSTVPDIDDVRKKRLAFLDKADNNSNCKSSLANESTTSEGAEASKCDQTETDGLSEEEMLKQAIAMSMSQDLE